MHAAGRQFRAATLIVTLPLGVLQARSVRFSPEPLELLAEADRMAMGEAFRLTLCFTDEFWHAAARDMSFLFTRQGDTLTGLPTWWTTAPRSSGLLTGWAGGPRTHSLPAAELLVSQSLGELAELFRIHKTELEDKLLSAHYHDWQRDRYSRGAYSYAPAGALEASRRMTAPVESTLFFAGEHTDVTGHWGTVHGALDSGLRAARQVLGRQ